MVRDVYGDYYFFFKQKKSEHRRINGLSFYFSYETGMNMRQVLRRSLVNWCILLFASAMFLDNVPGFLSLAV